jgi:hypothetical protein
MLDSRCTALPLPKGFQSRGWHLVIIIVVVIICAPMVGV